MALLTNIGLSFSTLYRSVYQDIFNDNFGKRIPFNGVETGLRMYAAMWDYRASLYRFLDSYKTFAEGKSEDDIRNALKEDYRKYKEFDDGRKLKGDKKITEPDYRKWMSTQTDVKNKELIKQIWEFNDKLGDTCLELRLGTTASADDNHGMYHQNMYKPGKMYKSGEKVRGVYIDPEIARQHKSMVDALFTEVVDKIVETPKDGDKALDKKSYIDLKKYKGWFTKQKSSSSYTITIKNPEESGDDVSVKETSINFASRDLIAALPVKVIETAKFLSMINSHHALKSRLASDANKTVTLKDLNTEKTQVLQFWKIFDAVNADESSHIDYHERLAGETVPDELGIITIKRKEGDIEKEYVFDSRIEDFFNVMFHGTPTGARNTEVFEEVDENQSATDAWFKYGFFTSPVIEKAEVNGNSTFAASKTSKKFYKIKVVTRMPQFTSDLILKDEAEEPATTETSTPVAVPPATTTEPTVTIEPTVEPEPAPKTEPTPTPAPEPSPAVPLPVKTWQEELMEQLENSKDDNIKYILEGIEPVADVEQPKSIASRVREDLDDQEDKPFDSDINSFLTNDLYSNLQDYLKDLIRLYDETGNNDLLTAIDHYLLNLRLGYIEYNDGKIAFREKNAAWDLLPSNHNVPLSAISTDGGSIDLKYDNKENGTYTKITLSFGSTMDEFKISKTGEGKLIDSNIEKSAEKNGGGYYFDDVFSKIDAGIRRYLNNSEYSIIVTSGKDKSVRDTRKLNSLLQEIEKIKSNYSDGTGSLSKESLYKIVEEINYFMTVSSSGTKIKEENLPKWYTGGKVGDKEIQGLRDYL